jgi:hypothetical protein
VPQQGVQVRQKVQLPLLVHPPQQEETLLLPTASGPRSVALQNPLVLLLLPLLLQGGQLLALLLLLPLHEPLRSA